MITDSGKWHYTALKSEQTEDGVIRPTKSLSRLFRGITSYHKGDCYCLNYLHSYRSNNTLKKHEQLRENNDYSYIEMPNKKNNTLKYSEGAKSLKIPYVIYADLECLLLKQQSCQNNPSKSYTERKAIHEPCGYSLDLVSSFDSKENKHGFHRGKDCIKIFSKELKKIYIKIVNYEQKEMIPLTDKKKNIMKSKKNATYVKKSFTTTKKKRRLTNYIKKLEIIVILQEDLEGQHMVFVI